MAPIELLRPIKSIFQNEFRFTSIRWLQKNNLCGALVWDSAKKEKLLADKARSTCRNLVFGALSPTTGFKL